MDILSDILEILFRSLFSAVALFIITKIMGYRQISQLSFYDYIIGISIGSISAVMATDLETDIWKTLVPMIVYGALSILLSWITMKSIRCRRFITGTSVVLIEDGEILEDSLKKVKYDLNDLLGDCRNAGYFDIADIEYAVMEHNGKISFLPYPDRRPATPEDFNLTPQKEGLCVNLILDGQIMKEHLKAVGKEEKWLEKQIVQSKAKTIDDILLATYDCNDTFTVYLRNRDMKPIQVLD
jgi:uncharacterized membrane protein YcaP (DUF421 family)